MSTIQQRAFWACFAGWSLDAFDSQLFGLVIPALIADLDLSRGQAGLISGVAIATAAVGGWLGGALSDRFGRVRALKLSIVWFGVGSLATACAPNASALIIIKALQGFGFGAEWAVGAALISDVMAVERRGRMMGAVQSGWAVGWGLAVIAYGLVLSFAPSHLAWRLIFALGAAPALLVLLVQRNLRDVPSPTGARVTASFASTLEIFRRENLRATLAGSLIGLGAHAGYYGLFTWLPTYLAQERHLSIASAGLSLGLIIVAFGIGCLTSGQLTDRIGRKSAVAVFAASCILVLFAYIFAPIGPTARLFLGLPLGFAASGIPAALGTLFSDLFPSQTRGSGIGFCYNAGRIISALAPFLIGTFGEHAPLGPIIAIVAGSAYALVIVSLLLVPRSSDASAGMPLRPQPEFIP